MSAANGFFGSRPFSMVNMALKNWGLAPINWQLPT
jgi:uracil-DNA glycosylase